MELVVIQDTYANTVAIVTTLPRIAKMGHNIAPICCGNHKTNPSPTVRRSGYSLKGNLGRPSGYQKNSNLTQRKFIILGNMLDLFMFQLTSTTLPLVWNLTQEPVSLISEQQYQCFLSTVPLQKYEAWFTIYCM